VSITKCPSAASPSRSDGINPYLCGAAGCRGTAGPLGCRASSTHGSCQGGNTTPPWQSHPAWLGFTTTPPWHHTEDDSGLSCRWQLFVGLVGGLQQYLTQLHAQPSLVLEEGAGDCGRCTILMLPHPMPPPVRPATAAQFLPPRHLATATSLLLSHCPAATAPACHCRTTHPTRF